MIGFLSAFATAMLALAGVVLDLVFGEPQRAHPLVGFGWLARHVERCCNIDCACGSTRTAAQGEPGAARRSACSAVLARAAGCASWLVLVAPPVALAVWLAHVLPSWLSLALHALLLWFALGGRSLVDHIAPVQAALERGDIDKARELTARVVTRELATASETDVARAAVESALENGNDAVFGALFWFAVAGGPGALAYRLANTLDAMWGYRTPRFLRFGWAAARLDDVANYVPARLTALTYALCGDRATAIRCWREQAGAWESPNAGPVMASGAGSLNVSCGGAARYHGIDEPRPPLGAGPVPDRRDIGRALSLVGRAAGIWLAALAMLAAASSVI